jgi:hypothetical protein
VRLNIRKATLRHWRSEFARNLRMLGVEANATERAVRGECRKARKDGIYRASLRGESTYSRAQIEAVSKEMAIGSANFDPGKRKLAETRNAVEVGWHSVASSLARDGYPDLARDVRHFVDRMPPPRTDREFVAHELRPRIRDPRVQGDRTQ